MAYEPLKRKSSGFADLRIGEKFFFMCGVRNVSAEQNVKVSEDSFISLGSDGTGFGGLEVMSGALWSYAVERLGMLSEDRYIEITAGFRR